jgi:hypothetical protein
VVNEESNAHNSIGNSVEEKTSNKDENSKEESTVKFFMKRQSLSKWESQNNSL